MKVQNSIKSGYLVSRLFKCPDGSFFLFGPRGTGKSTFLKHNFKKAYNIDLLDPVQFQKFVAHPEYLQELVQGNLDQKTIIIDEIQRIPELLPVVHSLLKTYILKPKWFSAINRK